MYLLFAEAEDRAVVDQAPGIRAPAAVGHAVHAHLADVAGDHAIEHGHGIGPFDEVLLHRADIVGAAGVADAEVLVVHVVVVVRELEAVPGGPGVAQVQGAWRS
jgi:hypothetical protein